MDDLRFAHTEGHTDICFDEEGKIFVSCGSDGDIRIWNDLDDQDPETHTMGEFVSAIALKDDVLYVASDENKVVAYSFPGIEFESVIAQFSTSVYHIACSKSGKIIACGGGDFVIKLFDTEDKKLTELQGHTGPILSLAFDPLGKFLASSACDGTVKIFNLENLVCVKTLKLFQKSNDFRISSTLCRLDWSTDGKHLAVPVELEIQFFSREKWELEFSFKDEYVKQTLSIVAYSPFGNYICASSLNGQLAVWDVKTKKCLTKQTHEKKTTICGLKWNPNGGDLVFSDAEGYVGVLNSPLNASSNMNPMIDDMADVDMNSDFEDDEKRGAIFDEDELAADDEDFSGKTKKAKVNGNIDDEDKENANPATSQSKSDDGDYDVFNDDDGLAGVNNDSEFDIGAIKASLEPHIFGSELDNMDEGSNLPPDQSSLKDVKVVEAPKPPVQTAFQPGSAPVSVLSRYMLYNNVGTVKCFNTDSENTILVDFHDTAVHHNLNLTNTKNHSLASLSTQALLLACQKCATNRSELECLLFASNETWTIEMNENEEIEAIALGSHFAACVTDQRLVRIISLGGMQSEVFYVPGSVVCCAAYESQLLIAYHKAYGTENNQCLNMMIVKVKLGGGSTIKEYCLPLNSKAFLTWLGFSDEGSPCIVDTAGLISLLDLSCGTKWIPLLNTSLKTSNKRTTYFVIGLSEIQQEIRYIKCKNSRFPPLSLDPIISVEKFSFPFCEMETEKGQFEETCGRRNLLQKCKERLRIEYSDPDSSKDELAWRKSFIQKCTNAVLSGRDQRALDLAELMPELWVGVVIQFAISKGRFAIAERLGEVRSRKQFADENGLLSEGSDTEDFSEPLRNSLASRQSIQHEEEEEILRPKPLALRKSQLDKGTEDYDSSSNTESCNVSLTTAVASETKPKSLSASNPFKSSSKPQNKKEEVARTNGIDDLLNNSMKSMSAKNSPADSNEKGKKSIFLGMKDRSAPKKVESTNKTGFNLYFEENKETIKSTMEDSSDEKELFQMALKLYKELPKSEKQKYMKNNEAPKENCTNGTISNSSTTPNGNTSESPDLTKETTATKRKEGATDSEEDSTPKSKKAKQDKQPDSTVRKLTQFAFVRKPK